MIRARIIVPKPFQSVQYRAAAVKKAFAPHFLSIKNHTDERAGEFWQTVMERHLDQKHSDFINRFTDAVVTMALPGRVHGDDPLHFGRSKGKSGTDYEGLENPGFESQLKAL